MKGWTSSDLEKKRANVTASHPAGVRLNPRAGRRVPVQTADVARAQGLVLRSASAGTVDLAALVRSGLFCPRQGFFVPGEVRSSKNHKAMWISEVVVNGRRKRVPRTGDAGPVRLYKRKTLGVYEQLAAAFRSAAAGKQLPLFVEITFVRRGHHRADWHNLVQLVADQMVRHRWITDDDMKSFVPVPNMQQVYRVDKAAPGVWIRILTPTT